MIKGTLQKILAREHLTRAEAYAAMNSIMTGEATSAQIGALLVALRMKGEQPEEIAGFAACMRDKSEKVLSSRTKEAVDLVGTGGDGKATFNISTVASFVVAGAGVPVAKHGNRAVSSQCGSADVLNALGVNVELNAEQLGQCLDDVGVAFLFAPKLHPAMKHAVAPRRELGVRTFFNILGPITNPAGVRRQLIGVYDRKLLRLLAEVLLQLEAEHIMLVHSTEGMDEISLAAPTFVAELRNGAIREYEITADDFGLSTLSDNATGGDATTNAQIALRILTGEECDGQEIVIANAAAGLYLAGVADSLQEGTALAQKSLASGAALKKLEALRAFTQKI
ncbi:anthranilate phosphoribosyltransferase [candidate division KSB1 bacterium]|nr:anthranilate phosphoribosyltransferase [candidate division KSB1 bacterium]